jgi:hypothetical protein
VPPPDILKSITDVDDPLPLITIWLVPVAPVPINSQPSIVAVPVTSMPVEVVASLAALS